MGLAVAIDLFTPCLIERETGKIMDTQYCVASAEELKSLKIMGWNFDWCSSDLTDATVYKLTLVDDGQIQGLVAIADNAENYAVHLMLAESAPQNVGSAGKYEGVGGHLFAIAAQKSFDQGYGGFVYFEAKNIELVRHYEEILGARVIGGVHQYRMILDESAAEKLLEKYTFQRGDRNV